MVVEFRSLAQFRAHGFDAVIDVRSPSEFAEDHIPGAISLPVLTDDERAQVGTVYVQDSPFKARKIGAALVARNAARHIETVLADHAGGWRPLVCCWRGGQRSGAFASILQQIGWRAETVAGGYRSYRRMVTRALYDTPWPGRLIVLDGNTGSAKTEVLQRLAGQGLQVLDLEGLAAHRGSVLGGMGAPQPSQKTFESRIAMALADFDTDRPVLVEAESSKVGDLFVPPSLWAAMKDAPSVVLSVPSSDRAAFLARVYASDPVATSRAGAELERLIPYHGRDTVATWQAALSVGAYETVAEELIVRHYDPRYAKSRDRNDRPVIALFSAKGLTSDGIDDLAAQVADAVSTA